VQTKEKDIRVKEKKIFPKKNIRVHEDYPPHNGFVIFESMKVRQRVLQEYGKYEMLARYLRCFCCLFRCCITSKCFHSKEQKVLEKHKIRVRKADEPSNVIWDNNNFPKMKKTFRRLAAFVFPILLVVASFVVIFFLNQFTSYG